MEPTSEGTVGRKQRRRAASSTSASAKIMLTAHRPSTYDHRTLRKRYTRRTGESPKEQVHLVQRVKNKKNPAHVHVANTAYDRVCLAPNSDARKVNKITGVFLTGGRPPSHEQMGAEMVGT